MDGENTPHVGIKQLSDVGIKHFSVVQFRDVFKVAIVCEGHDTASGSDLFAHGGQFTGRRLKSKRLLVIVLGPQELLRELHLLILDPDLG